MRLLCFVRCNPGLLYIDLIAIHMLAIVILRTSITKNRIVALSGYQQHMTGCDQMDHMILYVT